MLPELNCALFNTGTKKPKQLENCRKKKLNETLSLENYIKQYVVCNEQSCATVFKVS